MNTRRPGPVIRSCLPAAVVAQVLVAIAWPTWGQSTRAAPLTGAESDKEVALTALEPCAHISGGPHNSGRASVRDREEGGPGPARVSVLDIVAKLALVVLAVYGFAWGAKQVQRHGVGMSRALAPSGGDRLRRCAHLPLRDGASLHMIEVDRRPLLVATHRSGEVSLLLDLGPSEPPPTLCPGPTPETAPSTTPESTEVLAAATLRDERDWERRREALIRALSQRT